MSSPIGAATATARPRTKSVRSRSERTSTRPICGIRYGGSSSENADGSPRSTVDDKSREASSVIATEER